MQTERHDCIIDCQASGGVGGVAKGFADGHIPVFVSLSHLVSSPMFFHIHFGGHAVYDDEKHFY